MILLFEGGDGLAVGGETVAAMPELNPGAARALALLDGAARVLVLDRPLSGRTRAAARDAAAAAVEDLLRALEGKPRPLVYVFGDAPDAIVVRGGSVGVVDDEALRTLIRDAGALRPSAANVELEHACARLLAEARRLGAVTMR